MNNKLRRSLALAAISLVLLPWQGATAAPGGEGCLPLCNAHLNARHPASLVGRGDHKLQGYVDLHAPLSEREAREVMGYRGPDGQRLLQSAPAH